MKEKTIFIMLVSLVISLMWISESSSASGPAVYMKRGSEAADTVNVAGRGGALDAVNMTGRGGAIDSARLLSKLFEHYNPSVLPRLNNSSPLNIRIGLRVKAIANLDTRMQLLSLQGYWRTLWTDPYLVWEPEDFGNITYIVLSPKLIWMPDLAVSNSITYTFLDSGEESRVMVDYKGTVDWQPPIISDFICQVDVAKYPMDVNRCAVYIGSWMYEASSVKVSLFESPCKLDPEFKNGQFHVEAEQPFNGLVDFEGTKYSLIYFYLKISRRPEYTYISMVFPMVAIGLLSPLSFLIPPDSGEKVGVSLNVLLSTTVCVGLVRGDLPDRSDKISSITIYAVSILATAFISVLGNIVVLLVYRHETQQAQQLQQQQQQQQHEARESQLTAPRQSKHFENDIESNNKVGIQRENRMSCMSHDSNDDDYAAKTEGPIASVASRLNWLFLVLSVVGTLVGVLWVVSMMLS